MPEPPLKTQSAPVGPYSYPPLASAGVSKPVLETVLVCAAASATGNDIARIADRSVRQCLAALRAYCQAILLSPRAPTTAVRSSSRWLFAAGLPTAPPVAAF